MADIFVLKVVHVVVEEVADVDKGLTRARLTQELRIVLGLKNRFRDQGNVALGLEVRDNK